MSQETELSSLIERARQGDEQAIRQFLSRFEKEVRMMVRGRLPKKLRSQFDSMDFVQAVWKSFFMELRAGTTDFANVQHLRGYLAGMTRNKVYQQYRRITRIKKSTSPGEQRLHGHEAEGEGDRELVSPDPTPSQTAQAGDRLRQLIAGCSPQDVEVITLRYQGLTHLEIACRTGLNERTVRRIIEAARRRMEARGWK
jgi:RNA polymerase sigma factor (sigma-70 family)